jgi:hypothetical protein
MINQVSVTELKSSFSLKDIISSDDFLKGQKDCIDGELHKPGMSEDYDRGYACQYASEQVANAMRRML